MRTLFNGALVRIYSNINPITVPIKYKVASNYATPLVCPNGRNQYIHSRILTPACLAIAQAVPNNAIRSTVCSEIKKSVVLHIDVAVDENSQVGIAGAPLEDLVETPNKDSYFGG